MAPMETSRKEVEIKLAFDSPESARARLEQHDAVLIEPREFEDNLVYDGPGRELTGSDRLLRLRRKGDTATLTFKARSAPDTRHKVRTEHESRVGSPDEVEHLLDGLGYSVVYRYQKFRTVYEIDGVEAMLDETPIGCYVELEGPPQAIDRVAARLGFDEDAYIRSTYRDLHESWAAARGEPAGDMVFADDQR